MYGIVQNKSHVTVFRFYGEPLLFLEYKVYKTQEDFDGKFNGIQKLTPLNSVGIQAHGGKFIIYEEAYGIEFRNEEDDEIRVILDGNKEKETLEERKEEAILAEYNGGIVVPYSDLFKFSVEVVSANNGETIDILEGYNGNTWVRRSSSVYIPSSGILAGKPCMRLSHSSGTEIIPKENKETGVNNQSVTLETQIPYIIFISGLQVPHLEYSTNSLFIDSEDYNKTYYYTFT